MRTEYWVKNASTSDLVSSELCLKIPAGRVVNLCQLNPRLTHEALQESEQHGFLAKCYAGGARKLIKLPFAPPVKPQYSTTVAAKSTQPIPSRVRTSVVLDAQQTDFIEELTHFDASGEGKYNGGFEDILAEPSAVQAVGDSGETFDGKPFSAVVLQPSETQEKQQPKHNTRTKVVERKHGGSHEFVVETEDSE